MPQKKLLTISFKKIYILIFFIITVFLTFFVLTNFRIKKIIIVNNKNNLPLLKGFASFQNQLIFLTNEKKISDLILKNNPQLEEVKVEKKLPDTIIVYPQTAQIVAQLKTNSGFFLLSKKGKIIKKSPKLIDQLTLINFYQSINFYQYQAGNYFNYKEIIIALEFLEKLKNLGFNNINIIDIKSYDVIIFNKDKKLEILISQNKSKEKIFYEIESLVKKSKFKDKNFKKIDLRFNKPIITLYE